MRWLRRSALLLGLVTLLGSGTAFAQSPVPHLLNVQGVLRNVAGEVVTGQYPMTFRLFVDESGGAPLMEYPSPTPVDVTGGVFSVNVPVLTNLFADNPTMWLELQVGTDLMPRREVTSVGYAFMAERAQECVTLLNAAPDLDCSGEGCVDASELDPSIFWARADAPGGAAVDVACEDPNGCIIGSEIVDLTIEEADLADGAVTSPKLASDLTFTGDTTAGNLLVKGFLYTGDDFTAGNIRMTPGGALQNITTQQMSGQLTNTVATGTAPFVVSSVTQVNNLNADLLDGQHGAYYLNASNMNAGTIPAARLPLATTTSVGAVQVGNGLAVNGAGNLTNAGVLSVTATAPLSSTGGQNPIVSIATAGASQNGALAAADWTTFNNKLTTVDNCYPGATNPACGSGAGKSPFAPFAGNGRTEAPLGMTRAGATLDGWLSAADWNTFNNKASAVGSNGYVQNQTAVMQAASFRINGTAEVGTSVTAPAFLDRDDTAYYVDPKGSVGGYSALFGGSVGIGNTAPGKALDVTGDARVSGQLISTAAAGAPLAVASTGKVNNLNSDLLDGYHSTDFAMSDGTSSGYIQNQQASAQAGNFWIDGKGTVAGDMKAGAFCLGATCHSSWATVTGAWSTNGANIYNNNTGYVGIGTSTPSDLLDVGGKTRIAAADGAIRLEGTKNGTAGVEWYYAAGDRYGVAQAAGNRLALYTSDAQAASSITFNLGGAGALTELGRITHGGRLGLATTSPLARFQAGAPSAGVAAAWPSAASEGVLFGLDTDNAYFGLVNEGANAARGAIVFGDDTDDYFRVLFNNGSAAQTELIRILADGRMGLGTATPAHRLDVAGNVRAQGDLIGNRLCIGTDCQTTWSAIGYWALNGNKLYTKNGAGTWQVGINATDPAHPLTIGGSGNVFGVDNGAVFVAKNAAGTYEAYLTPRAATTNATLLNYGAGGMQIRDNSSNVAMTLDASRNVGIGIAPTQRLHVAGNAKIDGGDLLIGDSAGGNAYTIKGSSAGNKLYVAGTTGTLAVGTAANDSSSVHLSYGGSGTFAIGQQAGTTAHTTTAFWTNGAERARIDSAGNVGIGTTAPGAKLDVAGTVRSSVASGENVAMTAGAARSDIASTGDEAGLWIKSNGENVHLDDTVVVTDSLGVGTTPSQRLTVNGNMNFSTGGLLDSTTTLGLGQNDLSIAATDYAYLKGGTATIVGGTYAAPGVWVDQATARVGVGTAAPAANSKLDVAGNIKTSADIWLGSRSAWLGDWLNQSVKTDATPTFTAINAPTAISNAASTAATTPTTYGAAVAWNRKTTTAVGVPGSAEATVMGFSPLVAAGSRTHEVAWSDDGNLYHRSGLRSGAFGSWSALCDASGNCAGAGGPYVLLQPSLPGTTQSGNLHLSGTGVFDGKVGIGTAAPSEKLEVVGGSTFKVAANAGGDVTSSGPMRLHYAGSDFGVYAGAPGSGNLRIGVGSSGDVYLSPGNGLKVGIGTQTPTAKVHVDGGTGDAIVKLTASGTKAAGVNLNGSWVGDGNDGILRVQSGGTKVVFDGGDTVSIGTTNAYGTLHVQGTGHFTDSIAVGGGGGGTSNRGVFFPSAASDFTKITGEHDGGDTSNGMFVTGDNYSDGWYFRNEAVGNDNLNYMRIARDGSWYNGAGNFGVGTTAPAEKLDVNGNVQANAVKVKAGGNIQFASGWNQNVDANKVTLQSGGTDYMTVDKSTGRLTMAGTVMGTGGLCMPGGDCKVSWSDVVQGVTGQNLRGVIDLYGQEEGAALVSSTAGYQVISKTLYGTLESLFTTLPVLPGTVREYWLVVRKSDNCATASDWRFWFDWDNKNGHGFTVQGDLGPAGWESEGSLRWIKVPPTADQLTAAGGGTGYWRLEAKMAGACAGKAMRVFNIQAVAVDKAGGASAAVALASGGAAVGSVYAIGGPGGTMQIDGNTGRVGINIAPDVAGDVVLNVAGKIKAAAGGFVFPDGTLQATAAQETAKYWSQSGSGLYPFNLGWNLGVGTAAPSAKLHVAGGAILDTSAGSSLERTLTIKSAGMAQLNYGQYPGSWSSALQIQNNDNSRLLWLSPITHTANARFRAAGSGLDFYTGGTTGDAGVLGLSIAASGNVGVKTTSPAQALDVAGNINTTGDLYLATGKAVLTNNGSANYKFGHAAAPGFARGRATAGVQYATIGSGAGEGFAVGVNGGNSSFEITGADHNAYFRGNVGIQTASPQRPLDVAGTIRAGMISGTQKHAAIETVAAGSASPTTASLAIQEATTEGDTILFADYEPYVEWNLYHENSPNQFQIAGGDATNSLKSRTVPNRAGASRTSYVKHIFDQSNGNMYVGGSVGIGTASPSEKLDVNGRVKANEFCIGADCRNAWPSAGNGTVNRVAKFVTASTLGDSTITESGGNVGIGTAAPGYALQVVGASAFSDRLYKTAASPAATDPTLIGAQTMTGAGEVPIVSLGQDQGLAAGTGADTAIWSYRSTTAESGTKLIVGRTRIDIGGTTTGGSVPTYVAGALGVKTSAPAYDLDVNGTSRFSGNMTATNITASGTVSAATLSGNYTGTIPADRVSAGSFGSGTGGGNYTFPGKLAVGGADTAQELVVTQSDGSADLRLKTSDAAKYTDVYRSTSAGGVMQYGASDLVIGTAGAERLRVLGSGTNNGYVGVNTGSPAYNLDVNGDVRAQGRFIGPYNKAVKVGNDATIGAAGWYRIAQTSGDRASGFFNLMDFTSSRHQSVYFYASAVFATGNDPIQLNVNVLSNARHATNVFQKLRLVRNTTTYGVVYLEVYVENVSGNSVRYIMSDNDWDGGWTPVDWTAGGVPAGYTGIEYAVADMDFNVSNTLVVTDGGRVGIGTTAPTQALDVNGAVKGTQVCIGSDCKSAWPAADITGSGNANYLTQWNGTKTITQSNIWANGTNVGVGYTGDPGVKLGVNGQLKVVGDGSGYALIGAGSGCGGNFTGISLGGQGFSGCSNYNFLADTTTLFINRPSGGNMNFRMNNNDQMVLDTSGRLGIGSASPAARLQVQDGSGDSVRLGNTTAWGGASHMSITDEHGHLMLNTTPHIPYQSGNGGAFVRMASDGAASSSWDMGAVGDSWRVRRNAAGEWLTMLNNGNLGVGISPSEKLHVAGNVLLTGDLLYGNGNTRTQTRDNAGAQGGRSGFYETSTATAGENWPTAAANDWWHLIDTRHSNTGNNYSMQIAGSFFDQRLFWRKTNNNAASGWSEFASVGYVDNKVATSAITGSGTTGYMPRFTGAMSLGNSGFYDNGAGAAAYGTTSVPYKFFVNGSFGVEGGNDIIARYTSNETYRGTFRWYGLQLGNNGTNYILAGRTAAGGAMAFYTNQTADFPSVNGNLAMYLGSNGNVGLGGGLTTPQGRLHVRGNADHTSLINQDGNDRPSIAATGNYPQLVLGSRVANGNHGPTVRLSAYDAGGSTNFKSWSIGTSGQNATFLDIGYSSNDSNPHAGIRNHNGTTLMTLTNSGTVGIGTTGPGYKLHVNGTLGAGQTYLTNSDIYFTDTAHNHTGIGNTAGYAAIENASNFGTLMILGRAGSSFPTGGSGRRVDVWDYLNVNGTMRASTVCIAGDCKTAWPASSVLSGGVDNRGMRWSGTTTACPTSDMQYFETGGSGYNGDGSAAGIVIGNGTTAAEKLEVQGGLRATGMIYSTFGGGSRVYLRHNGLYSNNTMTFSGTSAYGDGWFGRFEWRGTPGGTHEPRYAQFRVNGDIQVGSDVYGHTGCVRDRNGSQIAGGCWSDARLKKDVRAFEPMLDRIARLQPVYHRWRTELYSPGEEDREVFGLIAQDVEKVMPELVEQIETSQYKSVLYHKIPMILLQGVRELKQRQDALARKVEGRGCPKGFGAAFASVCPANGRGCNMICQSHEFFGNFQDVEAECAGMGGHICTYGELYAMAKGSGASVCMYAGDGWHVGNRTNDNQVMFVSDCANNDDFEGLADKNDLRWARCCGASVAQVP